MALCALFAVAAGLAQAPQAPAPAAVTPQASVAMPQVVPSVAQFLATLSGDASGDASNTVGQICHTTADCGPGELCCYPCGIPDCNFVCKKVKRCPLIP
jgi:hypothetical protein